MYRIGYGTDIHRLTSGHRLVLGGVEVPSEKGSEAHSDGDVIIHALCDALLGAMGADDIGTLFPDTDARWKDADSSRFLREVHDMMRSRGLSPANIDITVEMERPLLRPFIPRMRDTLAALMGCGRELISIKAKTMEGLGVIGSGEALRASAVVLLQSE